LIQKRWRSLVHRRINYATIYTAAILILIQKRWRMCDLKRKRGLEYVSGVSVTYSLAVVQVVSNAQMTLLPSSSDAHLASVLLEKHLATKTLSKRS
jgi:hypothetical protein